MMAQSEDDIVLAAEFALGTLAADERAQAETRMAVDADFRRAVVAWEGQFGALNQMVGSIEPRPLVWERIRDAVGLKAKAQQQVKAAVAAAPASERPVVTPPATPMTTPVPPPAPRSNVIAFESRVGPWRAIALTASAIAAALIALIAVQTYRPELVPWMPKSAQPAKQVAQAPAPVAAQAPAAQYVALLQKDNNSPAFIMTVNARTKSFTIRRLGNAGPDPGKSYELWIVQEKLGRPRSLGLIGGSEFTTRPVLASYDTEVMKQATYAVTLEPENGAPNGVASGPIVYAGKLVEAVPAPQPAPRPAQ